MIFEIQFTETSEQVVTPSSVSTNHQIPDQKMHELSGSMLIMGP